MGSSSRRRRTASMVVVQVEWLAGRTPEQKEESVAGITDILGRVGGAQRENGHVVLHDVPPSNWAQAGELVGTHRHAHRCPLPSSRRPDAPWWRARQGRTDGQGIHPARRGGGRADNRARCAAGRTGEQGTEDLEQGYAVTGADLEECCER